MRAGITPSEIRVFEARGRLLTLGLYIRAGSLVGVRMELGGARRGGTALSEEELVRLLRTGDFGLPVRLEGSPYALRVWERAREIPFGRTATYGEIAALSGGSPRAVGRALRANPVPIFVPCHRVVGASGPGGFSQGLELKRFLLELEHENRGYE